MAIRCLPVIGKRKQRRCRNLGKRLHFMRERGDIEEGIHAHSNDYVGLGDFDFPGTPGAHEHGEGREPMRIF